MNKNIWAIHFNDIHIKNGNEEAVFKAIKSMVKYASKKGVKNLICGGDVFDSRSFQRLSHLKCWEKCLELFKENNMICWCNTGNHDKSLYNSKDNFIEPFKHHPSLKLFSEITTINLNGKQTTFSPFFADSLLENQLKKHDGSEVLIGHWSCDGSTYLGKSSKSKTINKTLLSKWKRVFLSHYHNTHDVNSNTTHLPSLIQDNFGEDNNKGFSIIYDDLTYDIVKSDFKELVKITIDLDKTSLSEIKEIVDKNKDKNQSTRIEFTGDESKLKSLDKSIFENSNIDVKLKYDKVFESHKKIKYPTVIEYYDESTIKKEFKKFCETKGYNWKYGKTLLEKFLKENKNGKKE